MKYVVTAEQAKEIDKFTIENVGIPSMVLMERAALAVVEKITSTAKRTDKILRNKLCVSFFFILTFTFP